MAIKIIGTSNIARQTCCGNCGSILEYLPVDIEEKIVRDYTGCADSESYIVCPQCNKHISVNKGFHKHF